MSVILQISLALQLCSFFPFLLLYNVLEGRSAKPNRDSCIRPLFSGPETPGAADTFTSQSAEPSLWKHLCASIERQSGGQPPALGGLKGGHLFLTPDQRHTGGTP